MYLSAKRMAIPPHSSYDEPKAFAEVFSVVGCQWTCHIVEAVYKVVAVNTFLHKIFNHGLSPLARQVHVEIGRTDFVGEYHHFNAPVWTDERGCKFVQIVIRFRLNGAFGKIKRDGVHCTDSLAFYAFVSCHKLVYLVKSLTWLVSQFRHGLRNGCNRLRLGVISYRILLQEDAEQYGKHCLEFESTELARTIELIVIFEKL